MQCHVKMGEGGRLIIPSAYRKLLNLHIGDDLILRIDDGELRIFRQQGALQKIQSVVKSASKKKHHTDDFIAFRKKDSD